MMADSASGHVQELRDGDSSEMTTPIVSVIMPCFNAGSSLAESVGSVQSQSFQSWELVVVDDGSTDGSWRILEDLARQEPRIRLFRQQNSGSASARNLGLRKARGAFIAFLDADDTWHQDFVSAMHEALSSHPEVGISYCGWQNLGLPGGRGEPYVPPDYEAGNKVEHLLRVCPWPIHAVLVRADIVQSAGGFDTHLQVSEDYDLWLRTAVENRLARVPRVLAYYHFHDRDHLTDNKARLAFSHYRAQRRFLESNPQVIDSLGANLVRELTDGEMLKSGFVSYWARDLPAARKIFRAVMRRGYGKIDDWKYMLPSLLPLTLHRALINLIEKWR